VPADSKSFIILFKVSQRIGRQFLKIEVGVGSRSQKISADRKISLELSSAEIGVE
jgi:hypothetical protein